MRFEALLIDYAAARDDERELLNQQVTLYGAVIATLTLFGALATQLGGAIVLPDQFAAAAPLVPLSLICLLQIVGSQATIRSFYLRALERDIRAMLGYQPDLARYKDLELMSYREIMDTHNSLSSGAKIPRILTVTIFASVAVIFIGLVAYMSRDFGIFLQFAMVAFYGSATLMLLIEAIRATVKGRSYFQSMVRRTVPRKLLPLTPIEAVPSAPGRSLLGYLVLPRPADLSKFPFFIIGASLSVVIDPTVIISQHYWSRFALLLVILELIIYQARYQINDLRGFSEDRTAPASMLRGRIPTGAMSVKSLVYIVLASVAVRIFLVVMACAFTFIKFTTHVLPALVIVAALAVPYEFLRGRERNHFAKSNYGSTETALVPQKLDATQMRLAVCVSLLVGLGYPARAMIGSFTTNSDPVAFAKAIFTSVDFGSARGADVPILVIVSAAALLYLLGLVFVSMTWFLEAGSYSPGYLQLSTPGREVLVDFRILKKPHLFWMFQQAVSPLKLVRADSMPPEVIARDGKLELWFSGRRSYGSIWSICAVLTMLCSALLSISLVGYQGVPSILLFAPMFTTVLYIGVTRSSRLLKSALLVLHIVISASLVLPVLMIETDQGGDLKLAVAVSYLAFVAPIAIYWFFERAAYNDLQMGALPVRAWIRGARKVLLTIVVGNETVSKM